MHALMTERSTPARAEASRPVPGKPSLRTHTGTRLPLLLVALVVVAARLAMVVGGELDTAAPTDTKPGTAAAHWWFGKFAGYMWKGHVTSLSAVWTVPHIDKPCTRESAASTWIGAESGGFIQIGTEESCLSLRGSAKPLVVYNACWGDEIDDFHPQHLFWARPGDRVVASLALTGGRWQLGIVDRTAGRSAHFATDAETRTPFSRAEWYQEDVSEHGKPLPYPPLSTVRFQSLRVNSTAPPYADLRSDWMSLGTVNWAPSPLYHDSFYLHPATVTASGARYLAIEAEQHGATAAFLRRLPWTAATARRQIVAACSRLAAALHVTTHALATAPWPAEVTPSVEELIDKTRVVLAQTLSAVPRWGDGLARWELTWLHEARTMSATERSLKRALGLPEEA